MGWLEALMEPSSRVATTSLREHGTFSAFGCGRRPDGTVQGYLQDGCESEDLEHMIRAGLDSGEFDHVLLVHDVHVPTAERGVWTQAISYNVGSRGMNKRILVPYQLQDGDAIFHPSVVQDFSAEPWPQVPPNHAFNPLRNSSLQPSTATSSGLHDVRHQ